MINDERSISSDEEEEVTFTALAYYLFSCDNEMVYIDRSPKYNVAAYHDLEYSFSMTETQFLSA
jgi:hypothetical protein